MLIKILIVKPASMENQLTSHNFEFNTLVIIII